MMTVGLIVLICFTALLCLGLGMAISHHSHSRTYERNSGARSGNSIVGWLVALFLGLPFALVVLLVAGWLSYESTGRHVQTATEVEVVEPTGGGTVGGDLGEQPVRPEQEELVAEPVPSNTVRQDHSHAGGRTDADSVDIFAETVDTADAGPALQFKADVAVLGTLAGVAFLILAGVWIAHRRQHWSLSGMARATVKSLWVVPMLAAVGWVGYQVWPHLSLEPIAHNANYNAAEHEFDRYVDETQGQFRLAKTTSGMPPWVTNGITSQNGLVHVPVHGGWRYSEEESHNEAMTQAFQTVTEDFTQTYPVAEDWRIDAPMEDLHAIRAEVTETKLIEFGDTEEPMYRTHLLVELSDEVRSELVDRWKPELQEFRMTMLLVFAGVVVLVCFAGGGCLSLDLRTGGHYGRWLRGAAVLAVVAAAFAAHGALNGLWFRYSV